MSEAEKNALDKTESLVRRLLERVGSALDRTVADEGGKGLTAKRIGQIYSFLEAAIESNVRQEDGGAIRVAPNHLKLLLTYEERSGLSEAYTAALAQELTLAASEFIADRRYRTVGPITVEVASDLFAKAQSVKATFTPASPKPTHTPPEGEVVQSVQIQRKGGPSHNLRLTSGEGPVYIGRAAGNAIRIDEESVSRVHCSLALRSTGEVVLCDLGSSNGTWVNGQIVSHGEARVLGMGDDITVGDVSLNIVFL
ncbi:MAG TPA: FhaA domain-containing protein [Blastocatellia bacterium]|nr:FhaA domain-containing protein [Blastocatellia bacterium]